MDALAHRAPRLPHRGRVGTHRAVRARRRLAPPSRGVRVLGAALCCTAVTLVLVQALAGSVG